jgi:hypothetical protein
MRFKPISAQSDNDMINLWTYKSNLDIVAEKHCSDYEPCCTLVVKTRWKHAASDTTDFNDGIDPSTNAPYYFSSPPLLLGTTRIQIADSLVNECNKTYGWGAKDFKINAIQRGSKEYTWSCE